MGHSDGTALMLAGVAGVLVDGRHVGSAFAYVFSAAWVTAAHVIGDATPDRIELAPLVEPSRRVTPTGVASDPATDVAVLRVTQVAGVHPFQGITSLRLGSPCQAVGLTMNLPGDNPDEVVPRLLTGHVQRVHAFRQGRYAFEAYEVSTPFPETMSGAPVIEAGDRPKVAAIAQGRVMDWSPSPDGDRRSFPAFGVAVRLQPLECWIRSTFESLAPG
jgi:hypothetical protein